MNIQTFYQEAKKNSMSVVFPEAKDERILRAARQLQDEGLAQPILIGNSRTIEEIAANVNLNLGNLTIINPETSGRLESYAELYSLARPKTSAQAALRLLKKPLNYAGMMVRAGDANAVVAGVSNPTARVIKAGLMTIGLAENISTPSSFFLMIIPEFQGQKDKALIYADCAVNVDPDAEQLADIALASAQSARKLLEDASVAMLSFSTLGSAQHALADKVIEATQLIKTRNPTLAVEGELQFDAAIVPSVAAKKVASEGNVAGNANVLIFPDLNAGNIAYKLTQYMAGAQAIGPFLQGFAKPISDLSRGASVEDIVKTTVILLATA